MTFFDADTVSVPFENLLCETLRDNEDAAHYLQDALDDRQDRHAVMSALKDIIRANRDRWILPFLAVYFALDHLNPNRLEEITSYMEEEMEPETRSFMSNAGCFSVLRGMARDRRRHGKSVTFHLNIDIKTNDPSPGAGMLSAQNSLKKLFGSGEGLKAYSQMQEILSPA